MSTSKTQSAIFTITPSLPCRAENQANQVIPTGTLFCRKRNHRAVFRKLNSNSWLKENVGYQKKKADGVTKHCFAPDTYDFLQASLGFFEPAFRTKDDYEEVEQYLRDDREFLEDHQETSLNDKI